MNNTNSFFMSNVIRLKTNTTCVSLSKDRSRIVSGSVDNTVRVWDAVSGELLNALEGHTKVVMSVSWSPLGDKIVSGSYDNTVRVWDPVSGELLNALERHTDSVLSVSWSPLGDKIVSGSDDKTVRVWDSNTGKLIGRPLEGHTGYVYSVTWSPRGDKIVSGSADRTVRVWDSTTGDELMKLEGHMWDVSSVSWSPLGDKIVSGSGDKTVRMWDSNTGDELMKLEGHTNWVLSVSFSGDGSHIVSGSRDGTVRVWDSNTGKPIGRPLEGHTHYVYSVSFSEDGSCIVSGSGDKTVRVWREIQHTSLKLKSKQIRTNERNIITRHKSVVPCVAWAESGDKLLAVSRKGMLDVYDVKNKALSSAWMHRKLSCVAPVGLTTIVGSDNSLMLWKTNNNLELQYVLDGHKDEMIAVTTTLTNTGQYIASISKEKLLIHKMYDDGAPELVTTAPSLKGDKFTALDWYKGHLLVVSSRGLIFSYQVKTNTFDNIGDFLSLYCIRWDPSGQRYATGGGKDIYILDHFRSGAKTLKGHEMAVYSVSWDPNGSRIVSGSADKSIRIWDVDSGAQTVTFNYHLTSVLCVAWSPLGNKIASSSTDCTVRLWDIEMDTDGVELTEGSRRERVEIDLTNEIDEIDLSQSNSSSVNASADYKPWGYVTPEPPYMYASATPGASLSTYHTQLDKRLQCNVQADILKLHKLMPMVGPFLKYVEQLRADQRSRVKSRRSVYLFLCIDDRPGVLQPDMDIYVYCVFALQWLGWTHRMVIYDKRATLDSIKSRASQLGYPLHEPFLKQNVTCTLYVKNYEKLKTAVEDIESDEKIALLYMSAHGDNKGVIQGPWDGPVGPLSDDKLDEFSQTLQPRMTSDCQVFLNSCFAGRHTAKKMSAVLGEQIVLAAQLSIPSGQVVHQFRIDATHNRLYFTANCVNAEIHMYSQRFLSPWMNLSKEARKRCEKRNIHNMYELERNVFFGQVRIQDILKTKADLRIFAQALVAVTHYSDTKDKMIDIIMRAIYKRPHSPAMRIPESDDEPDNAYPPRSPDYDPNGPDTTRFKPLRF